MHKMFTNRRNLLKGFAASPLAAKIAGEELKAGLLGINTSGLGTNNNFLSSMPQPFSDESGMPSYDPYTAASALIKTVGMPDWFEQQLRDQARQICTLDPDIVSKQAWSLNVKIITQRQRNYERLRDDIEKTAKRSTARKLTEKLMGGYWPW